MAADLTTRLGVVLVNWNRWADTVECLESLRRSPLPMRVVVVDNASADGSVDRIEAWARGDQAATATHPAMARYSDPPCPKPLPVERLGPGDVSAGGYWLTIAQSGGNLGFAGGNNVGLRLLLADPAIAYVWLLNNDTVVEADAPGTLLAALDANHAGMCGTTVRYYHRPDTLQALNGSRFRPLLGTSSSIAGGQPATTAFDADTVARQTDFVLGASLAVSRSFVETVGPMEESYFLYYEEIDWAWRNRGRFPIGFAPDAVVYHKEGGSIGSSGVKGRRSDLSEYYLMRSRLKLIARHRPWLLPAHWLVSVAQIGRRLWRRQPGKALIMSRALFGLKG